MFALLLVSAIWGSHPVVGKLVEGQMSPLTLTVWRFTIGALCYLPWFGRARRIVRQPAPVLGRLAATAVFWCILYPLLYYQCLRFLPPLDALLIVNTAPLLAALLAWVFLREQIAWREWAGIALAIAGVVVLTGRQLNLHASWVGVVLAGLAAVSFAVYTVLSRRLFQELALFDVLLGTSVMGAVGLWLVALCTGSILQVVPAIGALSAGGWWQFLYIAVVVSTAAYVLYGYGLGRLPAAISSAVTFYPQVVFAGLIQWLWLGAAPPALTWAAAAFILAGTFLISWKPRRKHQPNHASAASGRDEVL